MYSSQTTVKLNTQACSINSPMVKASYPVYMPYCKLLSVDQNLALHATVKLLSVDQNLAFHAIVKLLSVDQNLAFHATVSCCLLIKTLPFMLL